VKADNTDRKPSRLAPFLIIIGALAAVAGLWSASGRSKVGFLPEMAPADWIIYPVIPDVPNHPVLDLPTKFEDSFVLDAVPKKALLRIAGFHRYMMAVNGTSLSRPLRTGSNWKQPDEFDVAGLLRPGTNLIRVIVFNNNGPPALWFSLDAGTLQVNSGGTWQASYAGAAWCGAIPASVPKPVALVNLGYGLPGPLAALGLRWPTLLGFALFSTAACWLLRRINLSPPSNSTPSHVGSGARPMAVRADERIWQRMSAVAKASWPWGRVRPSDLGKPQPSPEAAAGRAPILPAPPSTRRCARDWLPDVFPLLALAGSWLALFANNLGALPPVTGFDAQSHMEYIRYIQEHGSLPLAAQGWEMYQPPLYYLLSATWLKLLHLSVLDSSGIAALRVLGLVIGVAHFAVVRATLRLLFPADRARAGWGTLLAACLPPMLYLSQYVTNEAFAAMLVSACIWLTIRALKQEQLQWKSCAWLGLCLGAALLAKSTAVVVLPPIFFALLWKWVGKRSMSFSQWTARIGLVFALCAMVGGWHYARLWIHYGDPLTGNWDSKLGFPWWQDDGYRTSAFYLRFGRVLFHPWSGASWSFCDGFFATLWGDGQMGNAADVFSRPPWNYDLMTIGYWLAVLPALAVLAGGIIALWKLLRQPSAEWFLLLGFSCLILWALIYMSMVVPAYAELKAFYGLSALVPFCVFGALGLDFVTRRSAQLRRLVCIGFGLWAINSYACFWISRSSVPSTVEQACALVRNRQFVEATDLLKQRLSSEPGNMDLQFTLAFFLATTGCVDEGARIAEIMVREHPDDCRGHHVLALAATFRHDLGKAIDEIRQVMALAPGYDPSWNSLGSFLIEQGNPDATISLAPQVLATARFSPELRLALGSALVFKGREAEADPQLRCACWLSPKSADTLAELAWKLATDPDSSRRNGAVAIRLAEQACAVGGPHQTSHLLCLAAAYAEAAHYPQAAEAAERAHASALAAGDAAGGALAQQLIERFETGQPYRVVPDRPTD
jgi:Tfp pilus assembly protein PilF